MRFNRLIILTLFVACKATTPSPTGSYSENLSIHRPIMTPKKIVKQNLEQKIEPERYTPLVGHIRQELDSIAKVAHTQNKKGKYVDGYVIQTYSGNDRDEAKRVHAKMYELFAHLKPKISYHQPNFRVKASRFVNRLRANRIHQQVKEEFPRALLIPERFFLKYE